MITLLLAGFLLQAEAKVDALPMPMLGQVMQAQPYATKAGAKAVLLDGAILLFCFGADLYSTDAAIRNGAVEANPLTPTVESRVGAKMMAGSAIFGAQTWLRLEGHNRWATVARWAMVAMYSVAIGINGHNAGWW